MKLAELYTTADAIEILADAANIDAHLTACGEHIMATGTPVPMRTNLGIWEEMRLDQRRMIMDARA